jgi:hypothetical protein
MPLNKILNGCKGAKFWGREEGKGLRREAKD